jgi:hypothetical protein
MDSLNNWRVTDTFWILDLIKDALPSVHHEQKKEGVQLIDKC